MHKKKMLSGWTGLTGKVATAVCVALVLASGRVAAQDGKEVKMGVFNHVALGAGVGTAGISVELAAPVSPYLALRAGVNMMPNFKFGTTLETEDNTVVANMPKEVDVEGKLKMTTGHVLLDIYPFKKGVFHLTAGAYFGGGEVLSVRNKEDGVLQSVSDYNTAHPGQEVGYALGDYLFRPTADGNVSGFIKVSGFRPYVGIGFGRAVPKHRLGFSFDMGVQMWGSPKVYVNDANGQTELSKEDAGGGGDFLKYVSKVSIWPVLSLRLTGRLF